ncbi:MAG TPA: sodium:proton antiporter NhaD [Nitrospiraceae bacterium]|nr:sodium:proton antiporter NhaD [Nitrospiraceae bacterium]
MDRLRDIRGLSGRLCVGDCRRKSSSAEIKAGVVAAGAIWILTAIAYVSQHQSHAVAEILRHNRLEYAELMLFLFSTMTFINTMSERNIFEALRARLVSLGLSLRAVFCLTGMLAFFSSSALDDEGTIMDRSGRGEGKAYPLSLRFFIGPPCLYNVCEQLFL